MASPWKCFVARTVNVIFVLSAFLPNAIAKDFAKKKITLGKMTFVVEVAETPIQHQRGLMFREKLKPQEGMLFIFSDEAPRFFWMKNTLIDLSIGYFDKNATLIDIQEMKTGKGVPDSALPTYASARPAMYALEMNKNWFSDNKVKIGTKLNVH